MVLASVGGFGNHVPGCRNEDGVGPFCDDLGDIVEQQVARAGQTAAEVGDEIDVGQLLDKIEQHRTVEPATELQRRVGP